MAKNVATFAIGVGVKDTVAQDSPRIVAAMERLARQMETTATTPFGALDRQIGMIEKSLERTINTVSKGFVSERALADIERLKRMLEGIESSMSRIGGVGTPGHTQTLERLQTLNRGIGLASSAAVPSPEVFVRLQNQAAARQSAEMWDEQKQAARTAEHLRAQEIYNTRLGEEAWRHSLAAKYNASPYAPHVGQTPASMMGLGVNTLGPFQLPPTYSLPPGFGPLQFQREHDLDPLLNARVRLGERSQNLINDYLANRDQFVPQSNRNLVRTQDIHGPETPAGFSPREITVRRAEELTREFTQQSTAVNRLAESFKHLSQAEREALDIQLRARSAAGMNVTTARTALGRATEDLDLDRYGRNSFSHSFRYGTQNIAFGIEDFLISTQYGGIKAGLRAMTNNLTAVAAAMTGSLNPITAMGVIGTVAVGGAAAPGLYDWALQRSGVTDENMDAISLYAKQGDMSVGLNRQLNQLARAPSSSASSLASFQEAQRARQIAEDRANALTSTVQRDMKVIGTSKPTGAFEEFMSGTFSQLGLNPRDFLFTGYVLPSLRPAEQLKQIATARESLKAAQGIYGQFSDQAIFEARREKLMAGRFREDMALEKEIFNRQQPLITGANALAMRQIQGAPVDPENFFNFRKEIEAIRRQGVRHQLRNEPEQLQKDEEEWRQIDMANANKLQLDQAQFQRDKQQRDWQIRGQMAGMDTNDIRRIKEQAIINKEQIEANLALAPGQRDEMLRRLSRMTSRQLASAERYPDLGSAVEIGTAADVGLRQNMFGPRKSEEAMAEGLLERILEELRIMNKNVKDNKPAAANIKK